MGLHHSETESNELGCRGKIVGNSFGDNLLTQVFSHQYSIAGRVVRKDHGEFFTPVTGGQVTDPLEIVQQDPAYLLQAFVSGDMAVLVVVAFEIIHIAENQREQLSGAA